MAESVAQESKPETRQASSTGGKAQVELMAKVPSPGAQR